MEKAIGYFFLHVDQGLGMGYIRHQGKTCLSNLNESIFQLRMDQHFESITRGMTDFREAYGALSCEDIRSHVMFLSRHVPKERPLKWAILARTSVAYGLARMFDILVDNEKLNLEIRIFRDLHEAEVWLGIRENRQVS